MLIVKSVQGRSQPKVLRRDPKGRATKSKKEEIKARCITRKPFQWCSN